MVMNIVDEAGKNKIREAVQAAERLTSGEFVTVIARRSDDYLYIPVLWAALCALITPGILKLLTPDFAQHYAYTTQAALFLVLAVVLQWEPLKMLLIPSSVKTQRASRNAHMQFYVQGLHKTKDHTGVLLFVSVAEHYVEIIADQGINDKLETGTWDKIVQSFVAQVKNNQVTDGFVEAVESCGTLMQTHFPRAADDKDELSNRLIEI